MSSITKSISNKQILFIINVSFIIIYTFCDLSAQRVGLEFGIAGIENFSSETNFGLSLFLSFNDRFAGNLTYSQWSGEDGNYTKDYNNPNTWNDGPYFGNSGMNLTMLYKPYESGNFLAFAGAGLGFYQKVKLSQLNDKSYFYQLAFTFTTIVKYKISDKFALYTKNFLSFEILDYKPKSGLLNLGIELKP